MNTMEFIKAGNRIEIAERSRWDGVERTPSVERVDSFGSATLQATLDVLASSPNGRLEKNDLFMRVKAQIDPEYGEGKYRWDVLQIDVHGELEPEGVVYTVGGDVCLNQALFEEISRR